MGKINFTNTNNPAVVISQPGGGVKEQTAGTYAKSWPKPASSPSPTTPPTRVNRTAPAGKPLYPHRGRQRGHRLPDHAALCRQRDADRKAHQGRRLDHRRQVLFNTFNSQFKPEFIAECKARIIARGARSFEHLSMRRGRMTGQVTPEAMVRAIDAEWFPAGD